MRALYRGTVLDLRGNVLPGATVTVRETGTVVPLVQTMYLTDTGGVTLANPLTADANGEYEFFVNRPQRVDLLLDAGALGSRTITVDVGEWDGSILRPEGFGAKGDGVADDTAAVRAAFDAANALARTGIVATNKVPGAVVILAGKYFLASLAAPIDVLCNVDASPGSIFIAPTAYAGVTVRVGHTVPGNLLQGADIHLPDIIKATNVPLIAGSTGTRLQNLFASKVSWGRTLLHETGIHFAGNGEGVALNTFSIGYISYCKVSLKMKPDIAGGYVNQNTFIGGSIQQSPGYDAGDGTGTGTRRAGWTHLLMDRNAIAYVHGNTFIGTSFEGDVSENAFDIRGAYDNRWINCRHEQGTAGKASTVSGDTITSTAHGLVVGDMVEFSFTSAPGGMYFPAPYYVIAVPTANTFKVSYKKGDTVAITFTSAGSGVIFFRPVRILISTDAFNNHLDTPAVPLIYLDFVVGVGLAGNDLLVQNATVVNTFQEHDLPFFRARNRATPAVVRPYFAAYAPTVNPYEDPKGWAVALSDRGILFTGGAAGGLRFFNGPGGIQAQYGIDLAPFEIFGGMRNVSVAVITALAVPANGTATIAVPFVGALANQWVVATPKSALPAGIVFSHGACMVADTISLTFGNLTAAPINLNVNVDIMLIRR